MGGHPEIHLIAAADKSDRSSPSTTHPHKRNDETVSAITKMLCTLGFFKVQLLNKTALAKLPGLSK